MLVVDQVVPGRSETLRAHTRKELAATTVIALPLHEASVKQRTGGVSDDQSDVDAGVWAGVLPLHTVAGEVQVDPDVDGRAGPRRRTPPGGPVHRDFAAAFCSFLKLRTFSSEAWSVTSATER